jgi:hypothetical protein
VFRSDTTLYVAGAQGFQGDPNWKLRTASIDNDLVWTDHPRPPVASMDCGPGNNASIGSCVPGWGAVIFDSVHHVVVTSNFRAGVWRYVEQE